MRIQWFYTFIYISIILLCYTPQNLSAELQIDIKVPRLQEGMAQIEAMLAANIGMAVVEIEEMASDTLNKPLVTSACGRAAGISGILGTMGSVPYPGSTALSAGALVGANLDTFNFSAIAERFENIQPEDDFTVGAGTRGITMDITLPFNFKFVLPGIFISFSGSFLDLATEEYFVNGHSAGLSIGYSLFRDIGSGLLSWTPLSVRIGADWGKNSFGTTVNAGVITESFDLDLDGSGPFPAQSVSIDVEPVIDVALETEIFSFSGALSTGITLADFISLYAGGGGNYTLGTTGISAESTADIVILGYLSGLIEEHGSITISGAVDGASPDGFSGFCFGGIRFDFGSLFLNIPVLFRPYDGLGAGITMGVSL